MPKFRTTYFVHIFAGEHCSLGSAGQFCCFGLVLAKLSWGSVMSQLSASGSVQGWLTAGQASAFPTIRSILQGMSMGSFLWQWGSKRKQEGKPRRKCLSSVCKSHISLRATGHSKSYGHAQSHVEGHREAAQNEAITALSQPDKGILKIKTGIIIVHQVNYKAAICLNFFSVLVL